jgi:hypothetical protein
MSADLLKVITESASCLSMEAGVTPHDAMDKYAKENGLTAVFAPWHPSPEYRIFKSGTLLSDNQKYPAGLVIVDESGNPTPYKPK